ncbi:MAG: hypothetical protein IKV96_04615 [Firmicutes bacterium]|nr:hypothetical protein [Bacillota bacterium]
MSERGSIYAQLSAAGGTIPIEGAKVAIIYEDAESQPKVQYFTTDASGITGELQIDTPDSEESLSPGNGGVPPFATLSVRAEHPQFQSVLVEGVQVFSGRNSIQSINMIPLSASSLPSDNLKILVVPPQNL